MDCIECFYKIEYLICFCGCVLFVEFIEVLEVLLVMFKCDLVYLCEWLDVFIEYDVVENGYCFGQQWCGGKYELFGVWFNEVELYVLLIMQQMLVGLDEQGVVGCYLQLMFDKIIGMLGVDVVEVDELCWCVKFIGMVWWWVVSDSFEMVGSVVVKCWCLVI